MAIQERDPNSARRGRTVQRTYQGYDFNITDVGQPDYPVILIEPVQGPVNDPVYGYVWHDRFEPSWQYRVKLRKGNFETGSGITRTDLPYVVQLAAHRLAHTLRQLADDAETIVEAQAELDLYFDA